MNRRFKRQHQRHRPAAAYPTAEVGSLPWLMRQLENGVIDGYIILDDTISFSVFQPACSKPVHEIVVGITAVYGRAPREIVMREGDRIIRYVIEPTAEEWEGGRS